MKSDFYFPGFPFPGGKKKQALDICALAPPSGNIFADVFSGVGNVFWTASSLLRYRNWWVNDFRTSEFFRAIARIGNTVTVPDRKGRSFYDFYKHECGRLYGNGSMSDEARVLDPYLSWNGGGYFAVGARTAGGGPGAPAYTRTLREAHRIMHAVNPRVTNWDYERVFECLGPSDFGFIDPPYLGATVGSYSASDLDHKRLIIWLKYAKFRWLLCEYTHPVYIKTFGQPCWMRSVYRYAYPSGERRTEFMWKNY